MSSSIFETDFCRLLTAAGVRGAVHDAETSGRKSFENVIHFPMDPEKTKWFYLFLANGLSARAFRVVFSAASTQVTKYLLAPVEGKTADALFAAVVCAQENIEFIPMGTISEHQREADLILGKRLGG